MSKKKKKDKDKNANDQRNSAASQSCNLLKQKKGKEKLIISSKKHEMSSKVSCKLLSFTSKASSKSSSSTPKALSKPSSSTSKASSKSSVSSSKSELSEVVSVSDGGGVGKASISTSSKVQCDLCKLSYSSEKELTEHLLSLMHHTKLEDKETNPVHSCTICTLQFKSMTAYREHIGTNRHKKNLNKLRSAQMDSLSGNTRKDKKQNWKEKKWTGNNFNRAKWGPPEGVQHWTPKNPNTNANNYNQIPFQGHYKFNTNRFPNDWTMSNGQKDDRNGHYNEGSSGHMNSNAYRDNGVYNYNTYQPRWGSGATDQRIPDDRSSYEHNERPPYEHNERSQYGHYGYDPGNPFTEDVSDYNCGELWLQQRENYLADMSYQDCPPQSQQYSAFKDTRDFSNRPNHSTVYSYTKQDWHQPQLSDSSYKDRKRPREEDLPESYSKTSKQFGTGCDPIKTGGQEIKVNPPSSEKTFRLLETKDNVSEEISNNIVAPAPPALNPSHELTLATNSDNLLERAERLCKELREKRESTHAYRSNLLKSKNHHNLNDKINVLSKKKQTYFKGHIKDASPKSSLQKDPSVAHIKSHSSKDSLSAEKDNSLPLREARVPLRSLEDIRKSIEKSAVDENDMSSGKSTSADGSRGMPEIGERDLHRINITQSDELRKKAVSGDDERDVNLQGETVRHRGLSSKQQLSKDSLLKMVNSPKSRTERVQLARMHQTRTDKSNPSTTARTNVNLEGLYDAEMLQDIQLDLGGEGADAPVIKLEDLSENVRNQIMSIIGGDLARNNDFLELANRKVPLTTTADSICISDDKDTPERKTNAEKGKLTKKRAVLPSRQKLVLGQEKDILSKNVHSSKHVREKEIVERLQRKSDEENRSGLSKGHSEDKATNRKEPTDASDENVPNRNIDADTSLTLNNENIMNRYPTIMGGRISTEGDTGNIFRDSGFTSSSSPSQSIPLQHSHIFSSALSSASLSLPPQHQHQTAFDKCLASLLPQSGNARTSQTAEEETGSQGKSIGHNVDEFTSHNRNLFDEESSISSFHTHDDENPSQPMSDLLMLSEKEEKVKEEMMTLELRLTRLHRLLDQAANQIDRCTERRNELREEEQRLTSHRLNLIRAVSSKQSSKTSETHDTSIGSISLREVQNSEAPSGQSKKCQDPNQKVPDSTQENNSDCDISPRSSLTKSEWLAKFSAFLPDSKLASQGNTSTSPLNKSQAPSTIASSPVSLSMLTSTTVQSPASQTCLTTPTAATGGRDTPSKDSAQPTRIINLQNLTKLTVFREDDTSLLSPSPDVLTNLLSDRYSWLKASTSSTSVLTSSSTYTGQPGSSSTLTQSLETIASPVMSHTTSSVRDIHRENIASSLSERHGMRFEPTDKSNEIRPFRPPPSRNSGCVTSVLPSPRNEDSDIGSVTSLASGSSLGEKISHYCKQNPGASLDVAREPNLSVILSGPSDSNDVRGADDQELNDDSTRKSLYGNLTRDAVKSAEALHLIERNEEGVVVCASSAAKEAKKKKRKTKQERDSGSTNHRRRRYIVLSSSSEGEDQAVNEPSPSNDLTALGSKHRKSPESTSDDSSSDVMEIKISSDVENDGNQMKSITDVTVAECDSSTNLDIVDSASINTRSNKLKEMNDSFLRTFGRSPKFKGSKSVMNTLVTIDKDCSKEARIDKVTQVSSDMDEEKEVVILCSESEDNGLCKSKKKEKDVCNPSVKEKTSSLSYAFSVGVSTFPSTYGSVCYLNLIREKLYVGYLQFGFQVFDLAQERNLKERGMCLPALRCMEALQGEDQDTILIGQGCNVCSIQFSHIDGANIVDLGTEVTCIHTLRQSHYVGLDTGEICVLDMKLKKKNRYICCDSPIYCMASGGQEGSFHLLCVSSLDSTITVLDSERCLPLRMLLGHKKTSFSMQVHDRFLYSGSGDSTVLVHNLHTAAEEKSYQDNKGIINSVFYADGFLYTGGIDCLVRCYNVKTHKLVQLYYGADMGAIKSIYVHGNKLITGNTSGSVDVVTIDLSAKNICPKRGCNWNFGIESHLSWHIQNDH